MISHMCEVKNEERGEDFVGCTIINLMCQSMPCYSGLGVISEEEGEDCEGCVRVKRGE